MIRKAGLSKVKLQSYVIVPDNRSFSIKDDVPGISGSNDFIDGELGTILDEDDVGLPKKSVLIRQGNKDLIFDFDEAFLVDVENTDCMIPSDVLPFIASSIDMLMLGYGASVLCYLATAATLLNSNSVTYINSDLEKIAKTIIDHLYSKIQQATSNISGGDTSFTIQLSCYELLDSQLKDLLNTSTSVDNLRMRESSDGQVVIEGLTASLIDSKEKMIEIITQAMSRRTCLVNGIESSNSTNGRKLLQADILAALSPQFVGPIGNMVIQLKLTKEQTISHISANSTMHVIRRDSYLNIISLATADALNTGLDHKGYKSFSELGTLKKQTYEWIAFEEQVTRNSQLKNSFKTLATFSRVINSLVEKNKLKESNTGQVSANEGSSKKIGGISAATGVHVPFRDSPLTRLLKPSLEGNCFLSMVTLPPTNNIDSASRALRFASQIGKLFNMIWINEQIQTVKRVNPYTSTSLSETDKIERSVDDGIVSTDEMDGTPLRILASRDKTTNSVEQDGIINFQNNLQEDVMKFQTSFDQVQNEMTLLVKDLDHLEKLHEDMVKSLSMLNIKPVKQYKDSVAHMNYQIAERLIKTSFEDSRLELTNEANESCIDDMKNSSEDFVNNEHDDAYDDGSEKRQHSTVQDIGATNTNDSTDGSANSGNGGKRTLVVTIDIPSRKALQQSGKKDNLSTNSLKSSKIGGANHPNKLDSLPRAISQQGIRSISISSHSSGGGKHGSISNGNDKTSAKKLMSLDDASTPSTIPLSSRSAKQSSSLQSGKPMAITASSANISPLSKAPLGTAISPPPRAKRMNALTDAVTAIDLSEELSSKDVSGVISPLKPLSTLSPDKNALGSRGNRSLKPVVVPIKGDPILNGGGSSKSSPSVNLALISPRSSLGARGITVQMPSPLNSADKMGRSSTQSLGSGRSSISSADENYTFPGDSPRSQQFFQDESITNGSDIQRHSDVISPLDYDGEALISPSPSSLSSSSSSVMHSGSHSKMLHQSLSTSTDLFAAESSSGLPQISPTKSKSQLPGITGSLPTASSPQTMKVLANSQNSNVGKNSTGKSTAPRARGNIPPALNSLNSSSVKRSSSNKIAADHQGIFSSSSAKGNISDRGTSSGGISSAGSSNGSIGDVNDLVGKAHEHSINIEVEEHCEKELPEKNDREDDQDNDEGDPPIEDGAFASDQEEGNSNKKRSSMEYRSFGGDADALKARSNSHSFKLQPIFRNGSRDDVPHENSPSSKKKKASDADLPHISKVSKLEKKKPRKENPDDFNSEDDDNLTPEERRFLRQVATGNEDGALDSVERGVNIHVKNTFERDAMQIAARNGNNSMLRMLYSHGASLNSRGLRGDTLFHLACYNGHIDTMRWLHRMGALPEAVDMYGQTAIHIAARRGELAVLRYLREDLNMDGFQQEDFDGRTPIDCIPRRGPPELELCREYLTDIYNEDFADDP